jgi:drug/metabolite transporter (DMT)-like permease
VKSIDASAVTIACWRMWIAAPMMVAVLYATGGRLTRVGLRRSVLGGVLFAGQIGLFFAAVQHTSVVNAQLINSIQPALVLLIAGKMFGERVTRHDIGWMVVAFAGVAMVLIASSGQPEVSGFGDLLAFANVFLWTIYFVEVKRVRELGMGAIEYMTGVMVIAAVVFTPYALLTSDDLGSLHGTDWWWILFIVLVPGAGGHVVMGWAHKYVDVSVSALMTLGVPVVSAIAAWWWLGEGMSAGQLVGGAIVLSALAAIVGHHRGLERAEDVPEPI